MKGHIFSPKQLLTSTPGADSERFVSCGSKILDFLLMSLYSTEERGGPYQYSKQATIDVSLVAR